MSKPNWVSPGRARIAAEYFAPEDRPLVRAAPAMLAALRVAALVMEHRQGDCFSDDYMGACCCGKARAEEAIKLAERGE